MTRTFCTRLTFGLTATTLALCVPLPARLPAGQKDKDLARKALAVLEANCYRCHGQNGAREGGFSNALDVKELIERKRVVPNNLAKSKLLRLILEGDMPPEGEKRRPTKDEVALLKRWIEAGAPAPPVETLARTRPFVTLKEVLTAIRDHLRKTDKDDRAFQRYFTLTHLHNIKKVKDQELCLYRAALSKLVNSLSWKQAIVVPRAVDAHQTVFAIDLRDLDWDQHNLWQEVLKVYPYGLTHDRYPDDEATREVASEVYRLAGTDLPHVRADWFIATAARPPLYHTLLRIPKHARELEEMLKVDVGQNFRRDRLARAGFTASGVSGQNRLVERHEAVYGAYWKSYDFKSNAGKGNLFKYPLGPLFKDHPYPEQAFVHDGGEIIFNLPNGLQGYMLVDGKDNRIDEGPVQVVSDKQKTSGTAAIVNGLSCMACHVHGMIFEFKDSVRLGNALAGEARDKVSRLYPQRAVMQKLLEQDSERFLKALDQATGVFLRKDKDDRTDIKLFRETVGPIARWYRLQELGPEEVAAELGMKRTDALMAAIRTHDELKRLGLGPLGQGESIKREAWETLEFFVSPYQKTSRILKLGTPKRIQ